MLLLGYILVTCHKNNIVTLHVTFMLYRRNETCLLGDYESEFWMFKMAVLSDSEFVISNSKTT